MTTYTNKHNIPEEIIVALENDKYDSGGADFTPTSLIQSPRIRMLNKAHADEIVKDVSDEIFKLLGQSVHSVLELANEKEDDYINEVLKEHNIVTEERLFGSVGGYTISGQADVYSKKDGMLKDYKVTSVWSVIYAIKDGKPEWDQQLNTLAWLHEVNYGERVTGLQIVAILRDWNKRESQRRGGDYPPSPVSVIPIELWSREKQLDYIRERINAHVKAETNHSIGMPLPLCNAVDRWAKPTVYALKKENRKSAIKLYPTIAEAEKGKKTIEAVVKNGAKIKYSIETRIGENTRCVGNYCGVAEFCDQFKSMEKKNEKR